VAQIFPRWTNQLPLWVLMGAPIGAITVLAAAGYFMRPEWYTAGYEPIQPIRYNHQLHAGDLGIDCRYCHIGVETGARATIPATQTCFNCHSAPGGGRIAGEWTDDDEPKPKDYNAQLLGKLAASYGDDPEAIVTMRAHIPKLNNADAKIREAAIEALVAVGAPVMTDMYLLVKDGTDLQKAAAVDVIRRLGPNPHQPQRENAHPMKWVRIHDNPDYVFFDHSIHVNKGVGCATCHGRIDEMPQVYLHESLSMAWCLTCHRSPEQFLRPISEITNMGFAPANHAALGKELRDKHHDNPNTNCSTCHR
jgi:hypothetical protein